MQRVITCLVLISLAVACAEGVPADPPESVAVKPTSSLVPPVAGTSGFSQRTPSTSSSSDSSTLLSAGSSAAAAGSAAAGSGGAGGKCDNLPCVDIFDCVFVYLGNQCGFTKCESVCK